MMANELTNGPGSLDASEVGAGEEVQEQQQRVGIGPIFPNEILLKLCQHMDLQSLGSFAQTHFAGKIYSSEVLGRRMESRWRDSVQFGEVLWGENEAVTRFRNKQDVDAFNKNHRAFSRRVRNFSWNYFPSKAILIEFRKERYRKMEFYGFATPLLRTLRQFQSNITTLAFDMSGDNFNSGRMLSFAIVLSSHLQNLKNVGFHKNSYVIGDRELNDLARIHSRCKRNSRARVTQIQMTRWERVQNRGMEVMVVPPFYFIAQCPHLTDSLLRLSIIWPETLMVFRYIAELQIPQRYLQNPPRFPVLQSLTISQPDGFIYGLFRHSPLQRITFSFERGTMGLFNRLQGLLGMLDMHSDTLTSLWVDLEPQGYVLLSMEELAALQVPVNTEVRFPKMKTLTIRSTTAVIIPNVLRKLALKFPRLLRIRFVSDNFQGRAATVNEFENNETAITRCWEETNETVQWATVMFGENEHHFSRPGIETEQLVPFPELSG